jgi:hypothetical protein
MKSLLFVMVVVAIVGCGDAKERAEARERYLASLTPEQKDSVLKRESFVSDSVAKHEAEQQADKKLQGKELEATVFAKMLVTKRLKFPKTADFETRVSEKYYLGGVYEISGTVEAQNAFGVPSEYVYMVKVKYNGGPADNTGSWEAVTVEVQ